MLHVTWDQNLMARATVDFTKDYHVELPDRYLAESLHTSYHYCSQVTAINSKSFYMASGLLPREKRMAIRALYAFCRTTDDIIDLHGKRGESELKAWRERGLSRVPRANDPVSIAWGDTRKNFAIPVKYAHQLIDGVERDVDTDRYETFSELAEYCYEVASTVGLMSMHIIGFSDPAAMRYAIKLGVALQLTNILRDIAEDYKMGRVYLPQEELRDFGITERHLAKGIVDDRWREFMRYQIRRTDHIYEESWSGIELLDPSGRLAIAAAATFYRGILRKIEQLDYNVFSTRACLTKWDKLKLVPGLWYKYGASSPFKSEKKSNAS